MNPCVENPFANTRAVSLSEREIAQYWVDIVENGAEGLEKMFHAASDPPMIIGGVRGSGKTHLLRYFDYAQQKSRHKENIRQGLKNDGYIGCYLNCRAMNTDRFKGKGYPSSTWNVIFLYYVELWLAQRVLHIFCDAFRDSASFQNVEKAVCREILMLFNEQHGSAPAGLQEMADYLQGLQHEIDQAVNGCVSARNLEHITVRALRGALIFDLPAIMTRNHSATGKCTVVYLVDDFEILTEPQQKCFHALIKDKHLPCSFKIAVHSHSREEDTAEGQYQYLNLDDIFGEKKNYELFARRLVLRRLNAHGLLRNNNLDTESLPEFSRLLFEDDGKSSFEQAATAFVQERYSRDDLPYFIELRRKLELGFVHNAAPGLGDASEIAGILDMLSCPLYPLLEKTNIYLLYKAWRAGKNLAEAAARIAADCRRVVGGEKTIQSYTRVLSHFKADLLAQLRKDCDQQQNYAGLKTFIDMSMGCARNLLVLLHNIFSWAVFNGEIIFTSQAVSIQSQYHGGLAAGEWFFSKANTMGPDVRHVRESVERLGVLFQRIRFSDKPSECSLTSFSFDDTQISAQSKQSIDLAKQWLFLVDVGSQKDRNTGALHAKLQINRMLAPQWDLPIYRRGTIALRPEEVNAIFDPQYIADYEFVVENRVSRMEAPYFAERARGVLSFF